MDNRRWYTSDFVYYGVWGSFLFTYLGILGGQPAETILTLGVCGGFIIGTLVLASKKP